jgi:hypothetical protein
VKGTIQAFGWKDNATLFAEAVAPLYLPADAWVLDPTYGKGGFWKKYMPPRLVAHDLKFDRPRPQPMEGRTQRHAHGQPSFLLVFRKPRRRR